MSSGDISALFATNISVMHRRKALGEHNMSV